MLVTSAYTPDKDAHLKRSSVTNEITGTGYTAGGQTTAVTIAKDTANDRITLTFAANNWTSSTLTARAAVIYKSTGTAANDNLVLYNDFGSDISTTNGTFTVSASVITFQN
jgi:hypothetical protein